MKHIIAFVAWLGACTDSPPAELVSWLDDWERTRTCLVGNHEGLADLTTSLKIATLRDVPCTPPKVPIAANLDEPSAELWLRAVHRIEQVFANVEAEPRAVELHALDADIAALRQRAGLEPRVRDQAAPLAVLGAGQGISVEGRAVMAHEITAYAPVTASLRRGDTSYELAYDGTATRTVQRPKGKPYAVFPRPSGAWFVETTNDRDHRHRVSDRPGALADVPSWTSPRFALDTGTGRAIVFGNEDVALAVAISMDRGATWRLIDGPPNTRFVSGSQDPITGALHLFSRSLDGMWLHVITPDALATIAAAAQLPPIQRIDRRRTTPRNDLFLAGARRLDCQAPAALWVQAHDVLLRIRDATATAFPLRHADSVSCNDDVAITVRHDPEMVERCVAGGCGPVLELGKHVRGEATLLGDGRWLYAAAVGDVVGIWREDSSPRFYRLALPGTVRGVPTFAGVPHLAVATKHGVRFIRIP
jgi:hypothetical protein